MNQLNPLQTELEELVLKLSRSTHLTRTQRLDMLEAITQTQAAVIESMALPENHPQHLSEEEVRYMADIIGEFRQRSHECLKNPVARITMLGMMLTMEATRIAIDEPAVMNAAADEAPNGYRVGTPHPSASAADDGVSYPQTEEEQTEPESDGCQCTGCKPLNQDGSSWKDTNGQREYEG